MISDSARSAGKSGLARAGLRSAGQVQGVVGLTDVDGLVTHPGQDLTAECVIVGLDPPGAMPG